MNLDIVIRALIPTDFAEINRVYAAICQRPEFPIGPHWSAEQLRQEVNASQGWVAELRGTAEVLGFILFRTQIAALEITFLGSAPEARKQGVMRRLITEMTRELAPGQEIWLEVHELNRAAHALYRASGFREVGRRPHYYPDGGAALLYNYG